jgi:hypothetical protein
VVGLIVLNIFVFNLEWMAEGPEVFRKTWPGLLVLLVYLAVRLLIFVLQQIPKSSPAFADIDAAMEAGLDALAAARIDITECPLFLIVGLPPHSERELINSPSIGRDVYVADEDLPVHWYGDADAIWITVPGISALSRQTRQLPAEQPAQVRQEVAAGIGAGAWSGSPPIEEPDDHLQSIGREAGDGGLGGWFSGEEQTLGRQPARSAESGIRNLTSQEKELARRRTAHFCQLLHDARYPVCTANGILLALPYLTAPSNQLTTQLAESVEIDMSVLQQSLGVKCLSVAVLTGIERSPEITEYVNRLPQDHLSRRCGISFPSLSELESSDPERAHHWLVRYFERQVFQLYQERLGDSGNGRLFRFLDTFRRLNPYFARLLNQAYLSGVREPVYFGGVYLAGTGRVGQVERPFLEGILRKLKREHDEVIGWNDQAIEQDRRSTTIARVVMAGIVILTIANAGLLLALLLR